jgi:hypothetical protein
MEWVMVAKHRKSLLALAAMLTFALAGCQMGKKELSKASYVSTPIVTPLEQLGAGEVPSNDWSASRMRSSTVLRRAPSSCSTGFS